jgi:hypothetical protein
VTTPDAGTSAETEGSRFSYQSGAPEFGRCIKVPGGSGAYGNSTCTLTGGKQAYEWHPALGADPLLKTHFTLTTLKLQVAKLETAGKTKVSCNTTPTGAGEYGSVKTVRNVTLVLTNCVIDLTKCASSGAAEGESERVRSKAAWGSSRRAQKARPRTRSGSTWRQPAGAPLLNSRAVPKRS